ncbi:MAG TPA: hypothetical protein VGE76_01920 [Opitutaceae bacterium]
MSKKSGTSMAPVMQLLKKLFLASILLGAVSTTYATVWSSAGNMTFADPNEEGWQPDQEEEEPPAPPEETEENED